MRAFGKILSRRGVLVTFLLAGIFMQAQVVIACGLAEDARQANCSCVDRMAGGCEMSSGCEIESDAVSKADCCVLSEEGASEIATTVAASPKSPAGHLNGLQPPPVVVLATVTDLGLRPQAAAAMLDTSYVAPVRTQIYLSTRRIRL